jgi:Immunoglobulin-like domain of bacterial spore germination
MRPVRALRVLSLMGWIALVSLACTLTSGSPAPTSPAQQSALQVPIIGLEPTSGAPGTVITIGIADFPTGAKVNLLVTPDGATTPSVLARDLVVAQGGSLKFAFSLPTQIGTVTLNKNTPLMMTVQTADGAIQASAVFLVTVTASGGTSSGGGVVVASPTPRTSTGGAAVASLFITAPAINSVHAGAQITVTGSGATFDNVVNLQLINDAQQVLANGVARIQSSVAGNVGPWQGTLTFQQPPLRTSGYIVAYTLTRNGQIAQQASIPVVMAGVNVPTLTPVLTFTSQPPAFPIIITATPWVITVTPQP